MHMYACRIQAAWERLTLSDAKGKRLLGYFHPQLRTTYSPVQICLKPWSLQMAEQGYKLRSNYSGPSVIVLASRWVIPRTPG